jgi:AcrR family transcriptional regulator
MPEDNSRKRTAETKHRRTRAALLGAARTLFTERGWHGTRIKDVAEMAGVSEATTYNHFRSKQALIGSVYAPLVGRLTKAANQDVENRVEPTAAILRYFYNLADLARRRRELTRSLVAALQEQALKDERKGKIEFKALEDDDIRRIVPLSDQLARLIDYGEQRGTLRPGSPSQESGYYYTCALLDRTLAFPEESAYDTARILLSQVLSASALESRQTTVLQASDLSPADDLSQILQCLMRQDSTADRRTLANDQLTREYLEAGLRLSRRQDRPVESSMADTTESPLNLPYPWVTEHNVICEVCERGHGAADSSTFHQRWNFWEDYVVDLMAYSLWARYWQPSTRATTAAIISQVTDPVRVVREVSRQGLQASLSNPAMPLSLTAAALIDRHPELRQAMSGVYESIREKWVPIYEEMFSVNDLRLRSGITIDDVIDIFWMLAEGAALHVHLDAITDDRQQRLLSKGALAVLIASIDLDDGLDLEDVIRQLLGSPG